eukprot:1842822-Amphidinium_carterae.1
MLAVFASLNKFGQLPLLISKWWATQPPLARTKSEDRLGLFQVGPTGLVNEGAQQQGSMLTQASANSPQQASTQQCPVGLSVQSVARQVTETF